MIFSISFSQLQKKILDPTNLQKFQEILKNETAGQTFVQIIVLSSQMFKQTIFVCNKT